MWEQIFDFADLRQKKVLITGASSGIGFETAKLLAPMVQKVIVCARRGNKLEELKRFGRVEMLVGDVRKPEFLAEMATKGAFEVDILVNNAGCAKGLDNTWEASDAHWQEMIDTNVIAAFQVSKRTVPYMLKQKSGHIVHITSVASHYAYAKGGVYCATKHALLAFAKSLRSELCPYNVRVSNISPGMVDTEFSLVRFDGDGGRAKDVYKGVQPLTSVDVARQVVFCLLQKGHVNLDEIYMTPVVQGEVTKVHRE